MIGGRYLARWAKGRWGGAIDEIVLLELVRAGSLPRMRLSGMLMGINLGLPSTRNCPVTYLDGDGNVGPSFEAVRGHLRSSRSRRILVGAVNDPSALGALRAFQEAGRADCCSVMGQNASPEARAELREPGSRLIGSVAYFPERYGGDLVRLSVDILNQRQVAPAVFVEHKLVTPKSVDHYYPNDLLDRIAAVPKSAASSAQG